ncbi:hypothetical protein NP493_7983g00002 [Ridgeia piscesae]|uniref:Uncharacterized protein n=1 Tax=Ridgeia piscesae TaxID=27915 RepID=A0AAD9MMU8_RIDPI|nr:hypothetical protein NP493_7983g00002 [Ridgeia piscesae]
MENLLTFLVVLTVGVVSPTVLDATDSVVAAEGKSFQSFQLFPPRQWSKLQKKHQIKSRFHILRATTESVASSTVGETTPTVEKRAKQFRPLPRRKPLERRKAFPRQRQQNQSHQVRSEKQRRLLKQRVKQLRPLLRRKQLERLKAFLRQRQQNQSHQVRSEKQRRLLKQRAKQLRPLPRRKPLERLKAFPRQRQQNQSHQVRSEKQRRLLKQRAKQLRPLLGGNTGTTESVSSAATTESSHQASENNADC